MAHMRSALLAVLMLTAMPALAEDRQAAHKAQVDQLTTALKNAGNETEAAVLEGHLRQLWLGAGTPAVTLLMLRGLRELKASPQEAEADFDGVIALDPDIAEAYDQRAVARFQQGKFVAAIADIEETLKREPRNFMAYRHLAEIAAARKDWPGAFAAWQKLIALDPKTPGGEQKLDELRRRAQGENI
jgi:tetratricopeptide (TPR) repeat protein